MASNEHAYLSEANLHNPKGLSLASNDTICSKNNAGSLTWVDKSYIKTDKITLEGYCTLTTNYQFPSRYDNNTKSPYDINQDYGSATISAATTESQKAFFRIPCPMFNQAGIVNSGLLQITSDAANPFTVAVVKYTPSDSVTTSYPRVIWETIATGLANDNKVVSYTMAEWTSTIIELGDSVFLMVKGNSEDATGDDVHIGVSLEVGYES